MAKYLFLVGAMTLCLAVGLSAQEATKKQAHGGKVGGRPFGGRPPPALATDLVGERSGGRVDRQLMELRRNLA